MLQYKKNERKERVGVRISVSFSDAIKLKNIKCEGKKGGERK